MVETSLLFSWDTSPHEVQVLERVFPSPDSTLCSLFLPLANEDDSSDEIVTRERFGYEPRLPLSGKLVGVRDAHQ